MKCLIKKIEMYKETIDRGIGDLLETAECRSARFCFG